MRVIHLRQRAWRTLSMHYVKYWRRHGFPWLWFEHGVDTRTRRLNIHIPACERTRTLISSFHDSRSLYLYCAISSRIVLSRAVRTPRICFSSDVVCTTLSSTRKRTHVRFCSVWGSGGNNNNGDRISTGLKIEKYVNSGVEITRI